MEEKRKYPRFDVEAKVQFKKVKDSHKLTNGFVKDISAEGFCFGCDDKLMPGEVLDIQIIERHLPEIPLCVKGRVVWTRKLPAPENSQGKDVFLTGVKIIGIRDSDEARFAMIYCERVLAELSKYYKNP